MTPVFLIISLIAAVLFVLIIPATRSAAFCAWDLRTLSVIHTGFGPEAGRASPKLERAMRDLTALSGDLAMGMLLLMGCWLLLAQGHSAAALRFAVLLVGARLIGLLLKSAIRRPRPEMPGVTLVSFTSSFPSVHTLMSFAAAFAILDAGGIAAWFAIPIAGAMAALIGATRLFFGVHWPSDVVAGWLAGLAICTGFAALTAV